MEGKVGRGTALLDALKLREAEEEFSNVLKCLWNQNPSFPACKNYSNFFQNKLDKNESFWDEIESLTGIAECRLKSFKMGLYSEHESWIGCFIYPLFLFHASLQRCNSFTGLNEKKNTEIRQRALKLKYQIKNLELLFIDRLCAKVFPPEKNFHFVKNSKENFSLKNMKQNTEDHPPRRLTFLHEMILKCAEKGDYLEEISHTLKSETNENYEGFKKGRISSGSGMREASVASHIRSASQPPSKSRNNEKEFPKDFSKKCVLNFEKFQESIQSFVKEVSNEMRSTYGHLSEVPRDKITNRITSELALRLNGDCLNSHSFETALISFEDEKFPIENNGSCDKNESKIAEWMKGKMECLGEDDDEWRGSFYEEEDIEDGVRVEYSKKEDQRNKSFLIEDCDSKNNFLKNEKCDCCLRNHEKLVSQQKNIQRSNFNEPDEIETFQRLPMIKFKNEKIENSTGNFCDHCINSICNLDVIEPPISAETNRVVLIWCNEDNKNIECNKLHNIFKTSSKNYSSFLADFKELPNKAVIDNDTALAGVEPYKRGLLSSHTATRQNKTISIKNDNGNKSLNYINNDKNMLEILSELIIKASDMEADKSRFQNALTLLTFLENIMDLIEKKFENNNKDKTSHLKMYNLLWERLGERYSGLGRVALGCDYLQKCISQNNNIIKKNVTLNRFDQKTSKHPKNQIDERFCEKNVNALEMEELISNVRVLKKLADSSIGKQIRNESLTFKFMLLVKQEIKKTQNFSSDNIYLPHNLSYIQSNFYDEQSAEKDEDTTINDSYLVCLYEAINHLTTAARILHTNPYGFPADLWCDVVIQLADCQVMAGNFELAEIFYDEVLKKLPKTIVSGQLQSNIHAILSLASLSFLSHNLVRAKTLLDTVLILKGDSKTKNDKESFYEHSSIEKFSLVWVLTLYSLCHLNKPFEAVTWLNRSIKAFDAFYNGFFNIDPLNCWFITHLLITAAKCFIITSQPKSAISKLTFAKNFLEISSKPDTFQMSTVWKIMGDAWYFLSMRSDECMKGDENEWEMERDGCVATLEKQREGNVGGTKTRKQTEEFFSKSENCYELARKCLEEHLKYEASLSRYVQQLNKNIASFKLLESRNIFVG